MRGNPQALFGKRPTEKDPAKGTSSAVDFTRREVRGNGPGATPAPRPGPTLRSRVNHQSESDRAVSDKCSRLGMSWASMACVDAACGGRGRGGPALPECRPRPGRRDHVYRSMAAGTRLEARSRVDARYAAGFDDLVAFFRQACSPTSACSLAMSASLSRARARTRPPWSISSTS